MNSKHLAACLATTLGLASSASALVYDNYNSPLGINLNAGNTAGVSSWVGDEVVMDVSALPGATHVRLSSFQFQAYATGFTDGQNITARVRFYANDGPLLGATPTPGSVLWDSNPFPITIQANPPGPVAPGDITYYNILFNADVNNRWVPEQFTWAVQFSDLGAGSAGVPLFSPPSIGGNFTDYWLNSGGGWTLQGSPGFSYDFAAQFDGVAVPEPGSVVTMSCIAVLGGFVAWRKRVKANTKA
jgi:hypothetical protein